MLKRIFLTKSLKASRFHHQRFGRHSKKLDFLVEDDKFPLYNLTFLTDKFQPYIVGFKLVMPDKFKDLIPAITAILLENCLTEYFEYDVLSRLKTSIDARLYYSNIELLTNYSNFQYQYPMSEENPLYVDSADAGTERHLNNIFEKQLWSWSPRKYCQLITYDILQRKLELRVQKITYDGIVKNYNAFNLVEVFTYGETIPEANENNLNGQIYELKDLSGKLRNYEYTMLGGIQKFWKQMTLVYKEAINWNEAPVLQSEKFIMTYSYNAVKQVVSEGTPDRSVVSKSYNQAGQLYQINLSYHGAASNGSRFSDYL